MDDLIEELKYTADVFSEHNPEDNISLLLIRAIGKLRHIEAENQRLREIIDTLR